MKKILLFAAMLLGIGAASAQNYVVVNTETVFGAITAYKNAESTLETLAKNRQAEVDAAFANVEKMYNDYMGQKQYLTELARSQREQAIVERENAATKRQQDIFGPEGEMLKKRVELMKPIQDRVFKAISDYGARMGVIVFDVANNPNVLYFPPAADKTQEIITLVR